MSTIEKALDKLDDAPHAPASIGVLEKSLDKLDQTPLDESSPTTPTMPDDPAPPMWASIATPEPVVADNDAREAPSATDQATAEPIEQDLGAARNASAKVTRGQFDIDFSRLARAGFITPAGDNPATIDEYRILKRPLLRNLALAVEHGVENANLVLVSSAVPGEGKTFTAVNLAMSIAMELDRTVLLVDGDVQRGGIARSLGVEADKGLVEYLENPELPLSDFLLRTNVPKLNLLPAGQPHAAVTELMASNQMRRFAGELAARYADRVVIFDGPPLLASSVAGVLARLAGQVMLVVEAIYTPEHVVMDALKSLGRTDNVGLVLNKSRHGNRRGYGGYGGYGYGASRDSAAKTD